MKLIIVFLAIVSFQCLANEKEITFRVFLKTQEGRKMKQYLKNQVEQLPFMNKEIFALSNTLITKRLTVRKGITYITVDYGHKSLIAGIRLDY